MMIRPLLQYFCSSCGEVLKETTTIEFQNNQLKEECPSCGALLIDTLQNRRKVSESLWEQEQVNNTAWGKSSRHLSIDFNTAYRQIEYRSIKLAFDIDKIDSLLDLGACGSLCIIGKHKYTQLLIDRLCVHSLLPRRYGGIVDQTLKIIAIDAGNRTDIYQLVDFARQYGLEVKKVLQSIVVSRVFTIYQFAHVIIYKLPKIIEQLSSKKKDNRIIVVYGLLDMFMSDPHIDKVDAKQLIQEIAGSIRKLSKDRFVIVSFAHCHSQYERSLLQVFNTGTEIIESHDNSQILQIRVRNHEDKKRGFSGSRTVTLNKRELMLVPPR
jgi:predicted RNA-binding Zn-ribbon protein involved in translation (DUF1610 family)